MDAPFRVFLYLSLSLQLALEAMPLAESVAPIVEFLNIALTAASKRRVCAVLRCVDLLNRVSTIASLLAEASDDAADLDDALNMLQDKLAELEDRALELASAVPGLAPLVASMRQWLALGLREVSQPCLCVVVCKK